MKHGSTLNVVCSTFLYASLGSQGQLSAHVKDEESEAQQGYVFGPRRVRGGARICTWLWSPTFAYIISVTPF